MRASVCFRPFVLWIAAITPVVLPGPPAQAVCVDQIDWDAIPFFTLHRDVQAVDANGVRTFPTNVFPVKLLGILLNNPEDMLDSTPFSPNPIPFNLGASWQVFVQAVDANDFGGTAVFMGQHYGNVPPNLIFNPGPTPDPSRSYTDAAWQAEMDRVNHDRLTGHRFRAGDLVEIHGQGALFFGGKTNINEEHFIECDLDFELELITAGVGLPAPAPLRLADIWNPQTNAVIFDPTRLTGGERYQGTLVKLLGVRYVDNGSVWAPGNRVTVADGEGRQFSLRLGLNPGFASLAPPPTQFNVVGIFNQEAGGPQGPATSGYEVWAMDPALLLAGDLNADGNHDCSDVNALVGELAVGGQSPAFDLDGSGLVDSGDLDRWLALAGLANLPSRQPYLRGDANLDGSVDGSDFGIWNTAKFTQRAEWCAGDFNADGAIDGSDFGIWNANKFQSSAGLATVPEPAGCMFLGGLLFHVVLAVRTRRQVDGHASP